jgi:hypothetical protein
MLHTLAASSAAGADAKGVLGAAILTVATMAVIGIIRAIFFRTPTK